MGTYVIEAARRHDVDKTVLVGTVCSYPKFTPVPFREETPVGRLPGGDQRAVRHRQEGAPRPRPGQRAPSTGSASPTSSRPTSTARATSSTRRVSHVIPALIKKCVEAVEQGDDKVEVWGTGPGQPRVPLRRRRRRGHRAGRRARTTARAGQPRHRPRGHDPRDGRARSPALVGFDGELRLGPDQARRPAPPPRRRRPGPSSVLGWRAHDALRRGPARAPSTGTSPTATRPSAPPADRGRSASQANKLVREGDASDHETISRRTRTGRGRCRSERRWGAERTPSAGSSWPSRPEPAAARSRRRSSRAEPTVVDAAGAGG